MSFLHQQYSKLLIVKHPTLSHAEGMVLMALGDKANEDSSLVFTSWTRLAEQSNCNERTVRRAITRLESIGLIAKRSSKGATNVIYFGVPDGFDPYKNEHQMGGSAEYHLSPEQRREAAKELYTKLTGDPWYAPCASEEEYAKLDAIFKESAANGVSPFDTLRQLTGAAGVIPDTTPPYDPSFRSDGLKTPNDRMKYDNE